MRWGGGATPSPDSINNNYPQTDEEELGEVIPYEDEISSTTVLNNYVVEKTAELNESYLNSITVDSSDATYRGNELPSGYTQIECLESSGTQYINTGIKDKTTIGFEINFTPTSVQRDWWFFGVYQGAVQLNQYTPSGKFEVHSCGHAVTSNYLFENNVNYKIKSTSTGIKVNENEEMSYVNDAASKDMNIYIFKINNLSLSYGGNVGYIKLYSLKLYDDESLVRDFIPCYDSNNVLGLYDVVENQFYSNQGTGNFNNLQTYTHSLQGSGTEEDPYQIGDFYDFEYIRKISGYNNSKHYILTDDIIFNDGKFVENEETGEVEYHAGSSGELRKWSPLGTFTNCSFDGNGHDIVGFYGKGFIWTWYGTGMNNCKVKNVHYKNAYCYDYGNIYNFAKALIVDKGVNCVFENCSTSGFSFGENGSCPMVNSAQDSTFYGCMNYAKIITLSGNQYGIGGIVGGPMNCLIENCKNYGKIVNGRSGGIAGVCSGTTIIKGCYNEGKNANGIAFSGATIYNCINKANVTCGIGGSGGNNYKNVLIENCTNYGECVDGIGVAITINNCVNYGKVTRNGIGSGTNIQNCMNYGTVTGENVAGIGNAQNIINCENHGDVTGTVYSAGGISSARFWVGKSPIYIYRCKNLGRVSGVGGVGGLSGFHSSDTTDNDTVTIVDSVNYGDVVALNNNTRIGGIISHVNGSASKKRIVLIQNCINEGNLYGKAATGGIIGETGASSLQIMNCVNYGTIKSGNTSQSGCFIGNNTLASADAEVKNCINFGDVEINKTSNWLAPSVIRIKNSVASMKINDVTNKIYYGTDFSAFFLTWKDARIGLISLESTGLYRGKLTEKYLYEHGFEPQDHEFFEEGKTYLDYYTQLEYLESTGTQWIDTGVSTNFNYKIKIIAQATSSNNSWLFGARIRINQSPWSKNGISIETNGNKVRFDFGNITVNPQTSIIGGKTVYLIDKTGGYCNGTKIIDFSNSVFADNVSTGNMLLGALNDTGSVVGIQTPFVGKIYGCEIYNEEVLVRDFVPVMRKSDNVFGLYDKVEGKFYTNQGTGNFIGA